MLNKVAKYPKLKINISLISLEEEVQIELIKSFSYDHIALINITAPKAIELYEKLKKVSSIIK